MSIEKVKKLADYMIKARSPHMLWTWGQGLFGGALSELDDYLGEEKYTEFLGEFCNYYVKNTPIVASSDTAAPALITYAMQKKSGKEEYKKLTELSIDYIKNEPRLIEGAVNHLGHALVGKIYPKSIWVDSLMMFSVFAAQYAKENNDKELMEIAAIQPSVFAKYLMDSEDNLWYHSYWTKKATHFPISKFYWGRGNGWVISALPKILDYIGEHKERENILDILRRTSEALLPYQREDGSFETVFNKVGKTYREMSATALIADGWLHSVRMGYLDAKYLDPALKAYKVVDDTVKITDKGVFMTEISAPTSPMPICPYFVYKITAKVSNRTYGVAAFIWAGIEYDKYVKSHKA